jgi:hypothetical protein
MREDPYTIRDDYDPGGNHLSADTDPVSAFLTYKADIGGMVGDMGFTLTDFREHIESLRRPLG